MSAADRWLTCTPRDFCGDGGFFARDSGLLCRGFQAIGLACRAVMTGAPRADDQPDLVRTSLGDLEAAAWWRRQDVDGVVLYAWGRPEFRRIAAAVRQAGPFLVLNQDNSGAISLLGGSRARVDDRWVHAGRRGMGVGRWIRLVSSLLYDASIGIWARDLRRLDHLRQGHVIGVVSPLAAARYRRHLRLLGGSRLAERVRLIPHPVVPHFRWDAGGGKRPAVAAVGRWDARWQKRPDLLCSVIAQFAAAHAEAGFHVVGEPTREMNEWRAALPGAIRERVIFHGRLPNEALVPVYQQARILLVPSLFESFHIAAGEALCCGCSVVGLRRPSLPSLEWFAEHDGTLAAKETADGLTAAVGAEWENWNRGDRDPQLISRRWSERLHAPEVARRIHELARGAR